MLIDFKEIPQANIGNGYQDTFELFARDYLKALGFEIIEGPSRGADGKKDLVVKEQRAGINGTTFIKWLVSVKHYAHSGKSVPDREEPNIWERIHQHNCDGFLGFYSTLPSSSLANLINGLKNNKDVTVEVSTYDREKIERELINNLNQEKENIFQRYFPKSFKSFKNNFNKNESFNVKEDGQANTNLEDLFLSSRDAVVSVEIEKIKFKYSSYDWKEGESILNELNQFQNISSSRTAKEIFLFLEDLANRTRGGMPGTTAAIIYWMLPTFYIPPYEEKYRDLSIGLKKRCIKIASSLIYDSSLYTNNLQVAAYGYNILKFVYLKAKAYEMYTLKKEVLKEYDKFEDIFENREDQDLTLAKELLKTFKNDLESHSGANPYFSGELRTIILGKGQ